MKQYECANLCGALRTNCLWIHRASLIDYRQRHLTNLRYQSYVASQWSISSTNSSHVFLGWLACASLLHFVRARLASYSSLYLTHDQPDLGPPSKSHAWRPFLGRVLRQPNPVRMRTATPAPTKSLLLAVPDSEDSHEMGNNLDNAARGQSDTIRDHHYQEKFGSRRHFFAVIFPEARSPSAISKRPGCERKISDTSNMQVRPLSPLQHRWSANFEYGPICSLQIRYNYTLFSKLL